MTYERKDGDIVLFRNERKTEQQPVMRGELLLGGVVYEVALWSKAGRDGRPFWTGNVKVKGERQAKKSLRDDDPPAEELIPF